MDYNEYRELTNTIDAYLVTGNRQTLASIQNCIETKDGCRERLMQDLIENQEKYITVFPKDEQVKIISDLAAQIKKDKHLAFKVSWMLPYVSDEVLEQILSNADDVALVKIMEYIQDSIRMIGHRICDLSTFGRSDTTIFSRMSERLTWRKLYKKCKKHLKK